MAPNGIRADGTNVFGSSVSVIDTASNTVFATVAVGSVPFGGRDHPGRAYVSSSGESTVSAIDTASNTVVDTVRVG